MGSFANPGWPGAARAKWPVFQIIEALAAVECWTLKARQGISPWRLDKADSMLSRSKFNPVSERLKVEGDFLSCWWSRTRRMARPRQSPAMKQ